MKSKAPVSVHAMAEYWPAFMRECEARLTVGAKEYGDGSHRAPVKKLIAEVQEELRDVSGWGFIAHTKLEKLLETIEAIEDMMPGACPKHPKYTPDKIPATRCPRCWMIYSVRTVQRDMLGMP